MFGERTDNKPKAFERLKKAADAFFGGVAMQGDHESILRAKNKKFNTQAAHLKASTPFIVDTSNFITDIYDTQEPNDCIIMLGETQINLQDLVDINQTFILENGYTCTISFIDGNLKIHSQDPLNITFKNNIIAQRMYISTKGTVDINTGKHALVLKKGMHVAAHSIYVKSELCVPNAAVEFRADLDANSQLIINRTMQVAKAKFIASKIQANAELGAGYLEAECQEYNSEGKLHVQNGGSIKTQRMAVKADITGENLKINASTSIYVYAKIIVDGLQLDTIWLYVSFWAQIDGLKKLVLGADYILNLGRIKGFLADIEGKFILSIFGGTIRGIEVLCINSVINIVALGGVIRGTTVVFLTGLHLNLLGLTRAYDYIVDSLISADLGIYVPEIPNDVRNITNKAKLRFVFMTILSNIYKPIGLIVKLLFKVYTFITNAHKLYERYQKYKPDYTYSGGRKSALNILNSLLNLRSMIFAARAVVLEKDFIINLGSVGSEFQHNPFSAPAPTLSEACYGAIKEFPVMFTPVKVVDAFIATENGIAITGGVALDALVKQENFLYQYELQRKPEAPKHSVPTIGDEPNTVENKLQELDQEFSNTKLSLH